MKDWFVKWFDTDYYHILYKDRDYKEAALFIDNITSYLNLPDNAKVLDLCCGKGRHSSYLNTLGFDVLGVDLSENSIAEAKKNENDSLHFKIHDMREPVGQKFDAVFNLFTSFGYFDDVEDNLSTLKAIQQSLLDDGFAVIDFMNAYKVIPNLVAAEEKHVEGVDFHITRWHEDGYIFKNIKFEDKGKEYDFTERVKALTLEEFESMMEEAGIYLLDIFGDYKLGKFNKETSDRLIMIFK